MKIKTTQPSLNPHRRKLLKGAGGAAALAAMQMPITKRVFGAEAHPLTGKKINMSILGIGGWLPSSLGVQMSPLFNDYVKDRYGYEVEFAFAEAPFADLFQKAATSLATKSQEYNIIISDSQWIGALSEPGWILKLNDIIDANPDLQIDWFSKTVVDTYMVYPEGSKDVYGLPQEGDTIALFLRKDMLDDPAEQKAFQAKYNRPLPRTYEEYEDLTMDEFGRISEFFTRPDQGMWGTAMQYSHVYDFITCQLYPFMYSKGGEVWNPENGQVEGILNSDINANAMVEMKDWLKYMPDGALNYGIGEVVDIFAQGKVFSAFQWAAVGLGMIDLSPGSTKVNRKENVLVVVPPKHGSGSNAKRIYSMGGQPWVLNAFNNEEQMRVGIDFLNWWYQPEQTLEFAKRGGNPCDKATLNHPDFDKINPWNRAYKKMLEPGLSRDFWHHPKYAEMLAVQQEAFTSYMTGQTTDPKQALTYAACSQQQILYDYGTASNPPTGACAVISL